MQWKTERYQFYKQEPAGEEEEKKLYDVGAWGRF